MIKYTNWYLYSSYCNTAVKLPWLRPPAALKAGPICFSLKGPDSSALQVKCMLVKRSDGKILTTSRA